MASKQLWRWHGITGDGNAQDGMLWAESRTLLLMALELNAKLLKPCIATIILRVLLQAVMIAGVLVAVHYLVGDDRLVNLAIISYMSAPATFSMQTFMKDEEGSAYVSTTNSMYCLVSILVYIIMAVTIY